MASELSKRLMRGGLSPSSSAEGLSKPSSEDTNSTLSSWSDNSDFETRESPFPARIENPLEDRENCFKRRKLDELTYAASRVKEDLEKGGLSFPFIHTDKTHTLDGTAVDMSSVRLLGAKSVANSPFLTPFVGGGKRDFQSTCDFGQLFSETQKAYSKRWVQDVQADWGDRSSAESLSSDSECSLAIDIPPRLDDALDKPSTGESLNNNANKSAANMKPITMGAALGNTSEPRLVTLSFAPFLVINVNSAYIRMTGIEAKDVLGRPFQEVFKDKRCKFLAGSVSSLVSMDEQLTSVYSKGQNKRSNCRLHVSVVGMESDNSSEPMATTHYMIAVESVAQTGLPSASQSDSAPMIARETGHHFEVMG